MERRKMEPVTPQDLETFLFRSIHPNLFLGTASDRYAGWIGQVYTEGRYKVSARSKRMGKSTFREKVLPVESVAEYFQHFSVLEVDYTFYALLLDRDANPTRTWHVLQSYARHLSKGDRLILKAPQAVFARKVRRGRTFAENPDYLDADVFTRRFYEPALDLLGEALTGIVFEQEYTRASERESPKTFAAGLDGFFAACPDDSRFHVEIRTGAYLSKPVFDVFEKHGLGQVLSHWTWLPSLEEQFGKAGRRFFNAGGGCVVRLMTPRGVRYEDAYKQAFPFDRIREGMESPGMIEDAVRIAQKAVREDVRINMVVNNRAGGNAPLIARRFARSFLRRIAEDS